MGCCVDWQAEAAAETILRRLEGHDEEVEECLELSPSLPALQTREAREAAEVGSTRVVKAAILQFGTVDPELNPDTAVKVTELVRTNASNEESHKVAAKEKRASNRAKRTQKLVTVDVTPTAAKPTWKATRSEGTATGSNLPYALAHAAKAEHPNICQKNNEANAMVLRRFFATIRKEHDIRRSDFNRVVPLALALAFVPLQCEVDAKQLERSSVFSARCKAEHTDSNWSAWWSQEVRGSSA